MTDDPKVTADEMVESLTGYEELAISGQFNSDIADLLEREPTMGLRALIFVEKHRASSDATAAKKAAMSMPLGQVMTHFDEVEFEPDPDDPETDQGKGDEPPSEMPRTSPSGV